MQYWYCHLCETVNRRFYLVYRNGVQYDLEENREVLVATGVRAWMHYICCVSKGEYIFVIVGVADAVDQWL